MQPFRLGTCGSPLALQQGRCVVRLLAPFADPRLVETVTVASLADALRSGQVDATVQSAEALPSILTGVQKLAATPLRGPTSDAFVSETVRRFDDLPRGAPVGCRGWRREAMLLHRRPDLVILPTDHGELDGFVVAEADLLHLGRSERIAEVLDETWMLPAVGAGAIAVVCREDDAAAIRVVEAIRHEDTWRRVTAERAMLAILGDGLPLGVVSAIRDGVLTLRGMVLSPDGRRTISATHDGPAVHPLAVGQELAAMLIGEGARDLSAL